MKHAILPAEQAATGVREGTLVTCSVARGKVMLPMAGVSSAEQHLSPLQVAAVALLLQGTSGQPLQSVCGCMSASLLWIMATAAAFGRGPAVLQNYFSVLRDAALTLESQGI